MIFTSTRFLVFLCLVLLGLSLLADRGSKKRFLGLASCFFYAAWDWRYLGLLLFISGVDYYAALRIAAAESRSSRKAWLLVSILSNLGVLGYFKYCNFFIENLNALTAGFGFLIPHLDILLPAGISFYTFKTMSYTIDVYRTDLMPCRSWLDYATFVTFFPELIAGPIVRASVFLPQMDRDIGPTRNRVISGASLFCLGAFKKVFIANQVGGVSDAIFSAPALYDCGTTWCGVLAYTIQIYCDFSGYSDMAIGTARMIGYDLPDNFNLPYLSADITQFWRRWHMTLSAWLRDYLYIPLGGNRHGSLMTYRNLCLTMLLGGLWHGASWNFVAWGGLHGGALAAHKLWKTWSNGQIRIPKVCGWALTLLFVMVCWVPFRSKSFSDTVLLLRTMVGAGHGNYSWVPIWVLYALIICVVGHLLGAAIGGAALTSPPQCWRDRLLDWLGLKFDNHSIAGWTVRLARLTPAGIYFILVTSFLVFSFAPLNTSPFIYFQF
jgi:alginate O-acetyltransferase complex protein AlgI